MRLKIADVRKNFICAKGTFITRISSKRYVLIDEQKWKTSLFRNSSYFKNDSIAMAINSEKYDRSDRRAKQCEAFNYNGDITPSTFAL